MLFKSIADDATGQLSPPSVYSIRGHRNPSAPLLCEKRFQNVAQYDEHYNPYTYHHKIRFKEMQSRERTKVNSQEEIERRREKERKKQEKGLRKTVQVSGVKLGTVTPVVSTINTTQDSVVVITIPGTGPAPAPSEKKSGFAVGGRSMVSSSSSGGSFKRLGLTQPTETYFTAASPTFKTTQRYDSSSSTRDIDIRFQERRLGDARRAGRIWLQWIKVVGRTQSERMYENHPPERRDRKELIPSRLSQPFSHYSDDVR